MDSTITLTIAVGFFLLFLSAGVNKFQHNSEFASALESYGLRSPLLLAVARWLIPSVEILLSFLVLLQLRAAVIGAAILLVGYALAMAVHVTRGNQDLHCGCQLGGIEQTVSIGLVTRNLILAALALVALAEPSGRSLQIFDYALIGAGVGVGALLYHTGNQLVANANRSRLIFQ